LRLARVVAPALYELEVVIAVPPEEDLDPLERARVVVVLEAGARLLDDLRQARDHRAVEQAAQALALGRQVRERELRGVQQLDRQPSADLHLLGIEGRVRAGASA